jgi:hypothetical protein
MMCLHGLFAAAILALGVAGSNPTPSAAPAIRGAAASEEIVVNCTQLCGSDEGCRLCCILR